MSCTSKEPLLLISALSVGSNSPRITPTSIIISRISITISWLTSPSINSLPIKMFCVVIWWGKKLIKTVSCSLIINVCSPCGKPIVKDPISSVLKTLLLSIALIEALARGIVLLKYMLP